MDHHGPGVCPVRTRESFPNRPESSKIDRPCQGPASPGMANVKIPTPPEIIKLFNFKYLKIFSASPEWHDICSHPGKPSWAIPVLRVGDPHYEPHHACQPAAAVLGDSGRG